MLVALAFPAAASAHARLVGSQPADRSVLATAPKDVRLLFDDAVRPTGGVRAVDGQGASVLAGPARRLGGNDRAVVIPLRAGLARGAYTVRWRVISNDGHPIEGVLAFGVGRGLPTPEPTLSAGGGLSFASVVLRLLFVAGVLFAGGAALAAPFLVEPGRRVLATTVVAAGLLLVAGGGFGLLALEPDVGATRFGRVTETAAIVALVGAAGALASIAVPPLRLLASGAAVLEVAAPTLSGHALDPGRLRALVALADFVHVAAASFWIGGLALLVLARSPRAGRRFPQLALVSLALLGAASIPRAIAAFPSLASVVDTGYGRTLLVKTGLLAVVLSLAWLNRARLRSLGLAAELVALVAVVAAVAVLTDLQPPARASTARSVAAPGRAPPQPPPDAVVLAGQDDDVAIGLAASPRGRRVALRITALGPDGFGLNGLHVRVGGTAASVCGSGCYAATIPLPVSPRRVDVSLSGRGKRPATIPFTLPDSWPAPRAQALVARADRVYRALRTLVIHERLASNARNGIDTTYRVQAPDRLAYRIVGGSQAVIIGGTRWDRLPGGKWVRSGQDPLTQPEPFWGSDPVLNARLLGTGNVGDRPVLVASFYDPRLPAWFELSIDPRTGRLLALRMTAQAHFMRHSYGGFDAPLRIAPPP